MGKQFEEDKIERGFFQAAPRPVTSQGRSTVSSQQAQILRDMMGVHKRPQTAATTTKKDEGRIKKKLQMLEQIERNIEEDIDHFNSKRSKKDASGVRVTKQMLLDAAQCDSLAEI